MKSQILHMIYTDGVSDIPQHPEVSWKYFRVILGGGVNQFNQEVLLLCVFMQQFFVKT